MTHNALGLLLSTGSSFVHIFLSIILIRVSLTWFPNVNWYQQPFYTIAKITDQYLHLFRGVVPTILGMDLSPLLGICLLQNLSQILQNVGVIYE
jgi:YggT family protein